MAPNKRRKTIILEINQNEFEKFARAHLSDDLHNTLIIKLGVRSYTGLFQCNFKDELIQMHRYMNEQDKSHLFMYDNGTPSSVPEVIPGVLREFDIFRAHCEKIINNNENTTINSASGNSSSTQYESESNHSSSQILTTNDNTLQAMILRARVNDSNGNNFNFRKKPNIKEDNLTDWSITTEEFLNYDKTKVVVVSDDFIVKEVTHIYVTQQRISHFFQKRMNIKRDDVGKFIFLIQLNLAWQTEQVYEWVMKTRTNQFLLDKFNEALVNTDLSNKNILEKCSWFVEYIRLIEYKPSGYA